MSSAESTTDFESIRLRLQEIVEAVSDDDLPLDDALDLYEEAVALGLRVSDAIEDGIEAEGEGDEGSVDGTGSATEETPGTTAANEPISGPASS